MKNPGLVNFAGTLPRRRWAHEYGAGAILRMKLWIGGARRVRVWGKVDGGWLMGGFIANPIAPKALPPRTGNIHEPR